MYVFKLVKIVDMKTVDEILKIKATVLYILKNFPDGVDYIKLFKIMYFAQQEHLVKYGKPIFNDSFYALRLGPVPSFSYKHLQKIENGHFDVYEDVKTFMNAFNVNENTQLIFNKEEPDMDELAVADVKSLDNVIKKYGNIDSIELSELSHDEAWKKASKRAVKNPEDNKIFIIDIAKAGGADKNMIEYIREIQYIKMALAS